jgi:hypothetical protein
MSSLSISRCVAALLVAACGEQNRYVAPPPPKVTVANPVRQPVTHYLEVTGSRIRAKVASRAAQSRRGTPRTFRDGISFVAKQASRVALEDRADFRVRMIPRRPGRLGAVAPVPAKRMPPVPQSAPEPS